jgi:NADPH:quinone reductase-like Zn-dependent oxidoreductase
VAAALPISGLTAWQGLFGHAELKTGQAVRIHGATGGVGSMAVQLARELGARVIGTGRAADREAALGLGADVFVDLQADRLEEAGEVDVVFDVLGGEVLERSPPLVRAGGTLVTNIRGSSPAGSPMPANTGMPDGRVDSVECAAARTRADGV